MPIQLLKPGKFFSRLPGLAFDNIRVRQTYMCGWKIRVQLGRFSKLHYSFVIPASVIKADAVHAIEDRREGIYLQCPAEFRERLFVAAVFGESSPPYHSLDVE